MTQLGFTFNASTVPPAEAGLPVWEGMVPVSITRAEIKPTAANDGSNMGILYVKAIAGEHNGQENVIRLNLWNKNAQAADIAQRQLSSICHCINRMQISDLNQLIGGNLLTVWEKQDREITDQATGQKRSIVSCQPREFRLLDGRTVREALNGQPASTPYSPNAPSPMPQHTGATLTPAGAPGFPPSTPATGFAPAPGGFPSPQAAPAIGTAGSAGSGPGFAPPAAAPSGFAPPAAPGAPAGGQGPWAGAPGGFGPPR